MTLLFLKTKDERQKQFGIINLSQLCYAEGVEETEEHPDGSKSRVCFHGGGYVIDIPYRQLADIISETIRQDYVFREQIAAARQESYLKGSKDVMNDVLGGHHHHD